MHKDRPFQKIQDDIQVGSETRPLLSDRFTQFCGIWKKKQASGQTIYQAFTLWKPIVLRSNIGRSLYSKR